MRQNQSGRNLCKECSGFKRVIGSTPARAFTIIELLIVIAVILILAGLLLPALQGARARARAVVCLGNLRQIGTIILVYEQEYNGFPSSDSNVNIPGVGVILEPLSWGIGGQTPTKPVAPVSTSNGATVPAAYRPVNRFLANQGQPSEVLKMFHCPEDKGDYVLGQLPVMINCWDQCGSSYRYVSNYGSFGKDVDGMYTHSQTTLDTTVRRGYRMAAIVAPAKKISLMESQLMELRDCNASYAQRHNFSGKIGTDIYPQGNVMFADGSARYLKREYGSSGLVGGYPGCKTPVFWPNCVDGTTNGVPSPCHDWY